MERLLEHREFLLRLARSLCQDESTAEDVVQETWLAALRRPPHHDRGLRAWLGRIVRRLASNRLREANSRVDRERGGARHEVLDPDRDLDGTLELQRDIVDTLRELREPYRRTLYLRFYRDLAPREIAVREELPLATVKSRLQRGLVELREALDRRHGGQRVLWATPLGGMLETGTETIAVAVSAAGWIGGMFALQKLVLAAVAVVALGGVWFVAFRGGVEADSMAVSEPAGMAPPAVDVAGAAPEVAVGDAGSRVELADAVSPTPAVSPGVVTGRLVFENGAPAPGIEVTMHRWLHRDPANPDRSRRLDPPAPARTDPEGRFEFRMVLEEPIGLSLEALLSGHVPVIWEEREVEPAGHLSLEEKTLSPAGSLFVQVRGPDGERVAGTWKFYVDPLEREDPDWERRPVRAEPDRSADSARFEGLPAGRARVRAACALAESLPHQVVEIQPGEELPLLFTYDGPALDSRIVIRTEIRPRITNEWMRPEVWRLEREGEAPRVPEKTRSAEFIFEDLPAGPYTLELLDPRYEPWRREGIEPGTVIRARLRGRSAIQLEVLGVDGERIADYALSILGRREGWIHEEPLRELGQKEPEGGVYRGLLPTELDATIPETVLSSRVRDTSWTLEVEAAGYSPKVVSIAYLPPDEITPFTVQLDRGATITGRVRSADGGPPEEEVQVLLTPGPLPAAFGMGLTGTSNWQGRAVPPPKAGTTADEGGRFSFGCVGEGEWTLRAVQGHWLIADQTIRVAAGESAEVELVMPPTGSLIVHFDVPVGADLTQTKLELSAAASTTRVHWSDHRSRRYPAMVRGAPCTFESLPAGEYSLSLIVSTEFCAGGSMGSMTGGCGALETVHLRSGERREMIWNLRAQFPARLGLRATVDGSPRHDVRTSINSLDDSEPFGGKPVGWLLYLTGDTGEDCPYHVSPGLYGITVHSSDGRWGYAHPDEIHLRPAELHIVELELSLQPGSLQFLDDETGEPLDDRDVEWFLGEIDPHISTFSRRLMTDSEGRLELNFPETELGLQLEGYEPVRLQWPPGEELEVRLRRGD